MSSYLEAIIQLPLTSQGQDTVCSLCLSGFISARFLICTVSWSVIPSWTVCGWKVRSAHCQAVSLMPHPTPAWLSWTGVSTGRDGPHSGAASSFPIAMFLSSNEWDVQENKLLPARTQGLNQHFVVLSCQDTLFSAYSVIFPGGLRSMKLHWSTFPFLKVKRILTFLIST